MAKGNWPCDINCDWNPGRSPYFALGQFSTRTLATSAVLLPFAVAANFFGLWLARRTPTEPFYRIAYLLVFFISLGLIWQGAYGLLEQ